MALALLLLARSVLLVKSLPLQERGFPVLDSCFYAPLILAEIRSRTHRLLRDDPTYNEALTRRYAELLYEDTKRLWAMGGLMTLFWCLLFLICYRILNTKPGFTVFGGRSEGLLVLMTATLQALGGAGQQKLRRLT